MTSAVDICNLALGKLAQDVPIANFSERSKEARTFARLYDQQRDLVLSERIWPFALKAQALSLLVEAPMVGWAYRYDYPSDCIQALTVCDENGARGGMLLESIIGGHEEPTIRRRTWRGSFEVIYGTQNTSIVSDTEAAFLIYTSRVEDVGRFSPMFIEALACKLALEAAPTIGGDIGLRLRGQLEQNYELALSKASANAQNEYREVAEPMTPMMRSRL